MDYRIVNVKFVICRRFVKRRQHMQVWRPFNSFIILLKFEKLWCICVLMTYCFLQIWHLVAIRNKNKSYFYFLVTRVIFSFFFHASSAQYDCNIQIWMLTLSIYVYLPICTLKVLIQCLTCSLAHFDRRLRWKIHWKHYWCQNFGWL